MIRVDDEVQTHQLVERSILEAQSAGVVCTPIELGIVSRNGARDVVGLTINVALKTKDVRKNESLF